MKTQTFLGLFVGRVGTVTEATPGRWVVEIIETRQPDNVAWREFTTEADALAFCDAQLTPEA